ncbi:MAG: hypothetical protein CL610_30160 [Anaerolineaceae bacterium]|nr:hypothetical protein [Anaerolineaceae bacterium]
MVMLFSASAIAMFCGVMCLTDSDFVWQLYQWDCRQMSITPPRMLNWQLRVRQAGYALIGLGVMGLMTCLGM